MGHLRQSYSVGKGGGLYEGVWETGKKRVGREFTRGGLGGRKRRGDLRRGIEGRVQGGVDSLPITTNMAAGANYMRIS